MPPIPNTLDQETLALISSAHRRSNDISEFQIPRLRACDGPLSLQQNFARDLREDLDAFAKQVEALDVSVDDQRGERNRRDLRKTVDELREILTSLRKDSRAALLSSKRAIDSRSQSQRAELLSSSAVQEKPRSDEKTAEDALMTANDNVTESLRRTIGLMQNELEKSVLTSQMLDASSATLRSTYSTHSTLTNVLDTSKHLLTALEKSDWLDRVLLLLGVFVFFMVVLFILKKRVLDKGLRVALFWTRFVPDFGADEKLLKGEVEEGVSSVAGDIVTAASTVVASAASTLSRYIASTGGVQSSTETFIASVSADSERTTSTMGSEQHDEL